MTITNRKSIDIRPKKLDGCKKCSNREARDENSEEGICSYNQSALDGLPIRCVGNWANDKIYYLVQYFGIFGNGMKNKWSGNLRYIELCSGPGRCSTRDGYEQDGTALSILNHEAFQYIADAIFIDYNDIAVNSLNQRINNLGKQNFARAVLGDYNHPDTIINAMRAKPFYGLTLCLIDPTACSIPFTTIKAIAEEARNKCDFIISFFDKTDFHRNAAMATLEPSHISLQQRYLNFLGSEDFFGKPEVIHAAKLNNPVILSELFLNEYQKSLEKIGFLHHDIVPIGKFYHLLYATGNPRGMEFWNKAKKYNPQGHTRQLKALVLCI